MSGVNTVAIPGHTPGHSGFRVDDGNDSLMHLGDIIHVQNLQLIDPNISLVFDVDGQANRESMKPLTIDTNFDVWCKWSGARRVLKYPDHHLIFCFWDGWSGKPSNR